MLSLGGVAFQTVVFISKRSEFELRGNGHVRTALRSGYVLGVVAVNLGIGRPAAIPELGRTMPDVISGLQRIRILSEVERS